MKVVLTNKEQTELDNEVKGNTIRSWLEFRDSMKFEIGDVLIKSFRRMNRETSQYEWVPETINSSDSKLAQRYVYIHEDDHGIGYLKMLKVSTGTLGAEIFCMTSFDYRGTRFEVDPEYAEAQLLDANYDIRDIHKKSLEGRKIATKMNRKMGKKLEKLSEFNDFFKDVQPGDKIWTSADYTGRYVQEYHITKIEKVAASSMNKNNYNYSWERFKERDKGSYCDATELYKIYYPDPYTKNQPNAKEHVKEVFEFNRYILYKQKPAQEDKK